MHISRLAIQTFKMILSRLTFTAPVFVMCMFNIICFHLVVGIFDSYSCQQWYRIAETSFFIRAASSYGILIMHMRQTLNHPYGTQLVGASFPVEETEADKGHWPRFTILYIFNPVFTDLVVSSVFSYHSNRIIRSYRRFGFAFAQLCVEYYDTCNSAWMAMHILKICFSSILITSVDKAFL